MTNHCKRLIKTIFIQVAIIKSPNNEKHADPRSLLNFRYSLKCNAFYIAPETNERLP